MKIEGIENITDNTRLKYILYFIVSKGEDVVIKEIDGYTFLLNDEEYVLISYADEDMLVNDFNSDLLNENICEVPKHWRPYVDGDKWIADNGINDIDDYWREVYDRKLIFETTIQDYVIYRVTNE